MACLQVGESAAVNLAKRFCMLARRFISSSTATRICTESGRLSNIQGFSERLLDDLKPCRGLSFHLQAPQDAPLCFRRQPATSRQIKMIVKPGCGGVKKA